MTDFGQPAPGAAFSPEQQELLRASKEAAAKAYAPYSNFRVGAAVLAADGRVFSGCNVENASYGLTLCAERMALALAVSEGACAQGGGIAGVAVFCLDAAPEPDGSLAEGAAAPCGACRQWLAELAPDAWVVTNSFSAPRTTRELLPLGFNI